MMFDRPCLLNKEERTMAREDFEKQNLYRSLLDRQNMRWTLRSRTFFYLNGLFLAHLDLLIVNQHTQIVSTTTLHTFLLAIR